jgi:phage terminase large subunit
VDLPLSKKQLEFLKAVNEFPIVFYGGAKGGGKSHGLRAILILKCLQIPKLQAALFRRTRDELKENHIDNIWRDWPNLEKYFHGTDYQINFPNGSKLMFRYCDR